MKPFSEKVYWQDIREVVAKLNSKLCEVIDDIAPKSPVILASYPYGTVISDEKYFYVPDEQGNLIQRNNDEFPYMILIDKNVETYVSLSEKQIPSYVHTPGTLAPVTYEINKNGMVLRPEAIYTIVAGVRNVSIMSLYGYSENYAELQRHFSIHRNVDPKNPQHHYTVIKSITDQMKNDWYCKMLIFSNDWMRLLRDDPNWNKLKMYILEEAIRFTSARRNSFYLEHAIFDITQRYRIKIKPFSIEMIKYTFDITTGTAPGLRPSTDETSLPLAVVTKALTKIFKSTTTPIIIEPHTYRQQDYNTPIYNPLFTFNFSMHDTKSFRPTLFMKEIMQNLPIYLEEFTQHVLTASTFYGALHSRLKLKYYSVFGASTDSDICNIETPDQLLSDDLRFKALFDDFGKVATLGFPVKSAFSKALTSITVKN